MRLKDEFFLPLSSSRSFSVICVIICYIYYELLFILVRGFKAISQINFTGSINSDSVFFSKLRGREIIRKSKCFLFTQTEQNSELNRCAISEFWRFTQKPCDSTVLYLIFAFPFWKSAHLEPWKMACTALNPLKGCPYKASQIPPLWLLNIYQQGKFLLGYSKYSLQWPASVLSKISSRLLQNVQHRVQLEACFPPKLWDS